MSTLVEYSLLRGLIRVLLMLSFITAFQLQMVIRPIFRGRVP